MSSTAAPQSLMDKFKSASSSTRTGLLGGAVVVIVIVIGVLTTDGNKADPSQPKVVEKQNIVSSSARATTNEDLAGEIAQAKKEISDQRAQLLLLAEQARQRTPGSLDNGHLGEVDTLAAQMQVMQERLSSIEAGKTGISAGSGGASQSGSPQSQSVAVETGIGKDGELVLGPDGKPLEAGQQGTVQRANEPPGQSSMPAATIQVVMADKKPPVEKKQSQKVTPSAYITSGGNFEAVLLNGMDASTAINANKTPTPALLRIKTEAILPNLFSFDVKECFVMVGGFGNMSTERVEMRTESMSCVDQSGQVWEGKIEGYLVGEDGKAGARGRVVSKQGALLAKSFMAGFIGGLGSAFSPQSPQTLNLTTNGEVANNYQYPSGSEVLGSGISKGLNQSGTALANFYIKLAEQMFPVVELDAGRKMTIILLKGVELKMDKKG